MTKLSRVLFLSVVVVAMLFVFMPRAGQAASGKWTDSSPGNYCGGGYCSSMDQACVAIAYAWYDENPRSKLLSCTMTSPTSAQGKVPAYCCGATYTGPSYLHCDPGFRPDAENTQGGCTAAKEPFVPCKNSPPSPGAPDPSPSCGNPVDIAEGTKWQVENDFTTGGLNALSFERHYNSDGRAQTSAFPMPLGVHWQSNFDIYLSAPDTSTRKLYQPEGSLITFTLVGSVWTPPAPIPVKLEQVADTWEFTDTADRVYVFDSSLRLVAITKRNGYQQTLAYDSEGRLETVTDTYGRSFTFGYSGKRLTSLTAPDGSLYNYVYDRAGGQSYMDQNRLVEVHHPSDGLPEERPKTIYHYEDPELVGYLTGITDEKGVRFATWAYNAEGRATLSEHAGGADRVTLAYNPDGSRTVTGPLGQQTIYRYTKIAGVLRLTSVERQATAKVPAATETRTYDANGFIQQLTDFEGNVTTFVHDARGLQTSRTEASGTPEARTITTTWHPTFRLPDVVTEPGRTSDFDYDAQGRMTSVTITDTTGHTVPYSTNGEARTWTYTYNGSGQVLTVDGPRSDVTDVTTFEYDAQGNRNKVINALGQTTFITAFNGRGLPLTLLDPNNVETELSYNPRGWLVERRVRHPSGDAVTSLDYDDTGQVVTITQPNGARLHYDYDDARRLTAVRNDLGERIDYTLDAMGNRTAETVKSTTGTIKRSQTRVFDELGRLLQSVGAASQTWVYVYDNNSNLESITDPATGETQRAFDALDRLIQVTDPALGVAGYGYDARDNLTSVSDQRSLTTAYVHNAFGDVIQTDSPDTGIMVYLVDPAGNATQMTDARGVVANFTHDALNRVLTKTFPADAAQNETFGYDDAVGGNYGVGRLTSATDQSGNTAYRYDHRGNLVEEARTIGATTFTTGYAYDLADNVVKVTYPSGRIVNYDRDGLGRVAGVTTQESAAAVPVTIASDVTYLPFGPMESFTFGNGLTVTYGYDQDYRLQDIDTGDGVTAVQDLTIGYDGRDNITAITDNLDPSRDQGFGYDVLSRLTSASGPYGDIAYTYDAVGNRETRDVTLGAVTTNEVYSYALDSNRLLSVDVGGTLRSVIHGASGNIVADDRGADPDLGFDYDLDDRLVQVNRGGLPLKQYVYNAAGERVVKQAPGGFDPEYFHYDQAGRLLAESDGTGAWPRSYVYLNGLMIAQVEPGSGAGTPIDVILDNGTAGTMPSGTWTASTAGQGFEGADHMLRPAPPEGIDGGILIDNLSPAFTSTASCAASTADPGYEGADYRVCAVDTGVDYAEEVPLTLVNPNAETGDVSGWTSESGTFGVRAANPAPIEGASYFFGGSSGQSRMYQDVAVPAAQQAAVDAGGWFARLTWQQNSYDSKDRGSAILVFLDAGGQPLAPDLESLRRTPGSWSLRELRAAVPPLTRTIRVKLRALRTRGDNNDAYFDDIALSLLRSDSDLRRLSLGLQNGDAETGNTSGWTIEAGGFGPRSSNPAPVQGGAYFIAGAAANSRMYQDLAIPAAQIPKVDAGNRSVEVNWRQASYDGKDKGSVILQFLDSGGLAIGADVESDLIAASKYWTDRQLSAAVPAGTRTIRLKLRGQRSNGTNNDAYFDTVTADLLLYGASAGSPPAAAATWRFQVSSSEDYRIYAKWPDGAGLATNASYRVFHALGASTAVTKSQRQGGGGWTLLGTFGLTAGEEHWVELADQANGPVAADAIYLVPTSSPTGSFSWAPTLPSAGDYGVYAKWVADAGRASDAVYGIYHTGGLAEVAQDQRAGAGQWRYLGTYAFDPAGSPLVVLAGGTDGTLSADAIRFVGAGPAPAALRFVHNDHLGTPQKLTDNTGALVWDRIQTPFGLDHSVTGAAATPVRFPGQYADGESALHYNYFRDYDPSLGRYIQSDRIGLAGGVNTYGYSSQNPVIYVDPDGQVAQRAIAGFFWGAGTEGAIQAWKYGDNWHCYDFGRMLAAGIVGAGLRPLLGAMLGRWGSAAWGSAAGSRAGGAGGAAAGNAGGRFGGGAGGAAGTRGAGGSSGSAASRGGGGDRFPDSPGDMTRTLGVDPKISQTQHGTTRVKWEPNSNTRIRYESHPGDVGTYNPRHHGPHYHVETKPSNMTWGQAKRRGEIEKIKPDGYKLGDGTGFLPGEKFPGM